MKVFISPPNSLTLYDIVERFGHEPLAIMEGIGEGVKKPEIDSPPLNITEMESKKGLKYASNEVPSGIRGRMALFGPLIEEAGAAIFVEGADRSFGCVGCTRTNELIKHLVKRRNIPTLTVYYPGNAEEGRLMVKAIKDFLGGLG